MDGKNESIHSFYESDKELQFASNYFNKNVANQERDRNVSCLFSAISLVAEQFSTVTIQQDGKNIVLAIPYSIIDFQDKRKAIIDKYYQNSYLQQNLSKTVDLKNKIFETKNMRISNLPTQDLKELNKHLKDYGYIEKNSRVFSKILLLTAKIPDMVDSEEKEVFFEIAIPISKITPASSINTVLEFNSITHWVENFDPVLLQSLNKHLQTQKLIKLENVYNKVIHLEQKITNQSKNHISYSDKSYLPIHIIDIQKLRKKIEKKYFQVYIPMIKHLKILENIEKQQKIH